MGSGRHSGRSARSTARPATGAASPPSYPESAYTPVCCHCGRRRCRHRALSAHAHACARPVYTGLTNACNADDCFGEAGVQLATYDGVKGLVTAADGPLGLAADRFTTHLGCSVLTTFCAVTALQPFDFLSVRLMNQPAATAATAATGPRYSGMLDCAAQTLRTEGAAGFFKGVRPRTNCTATAVPRCRLRMWHLLMQCRCRCIL